MVPRTCLDDVEKRKFLTLPGLELRPLGASEEIWPEDVEWIVLIRDIIQWRAPVYAVMNLRFPSKVRNFLTSKATVSFSRITLLHKVN
jgi:hypothetical protein